MQMHELRHVVSQTHPEDWNRIMDGPPGMLVPPHATGHDAYAVLNSDLDISLAWGLDHDQHDYDAGVAQEPRTYSWLSGLGDEEARFQYADLYLRTSLVDRVAVLIVDGGHGVLPFPRGKGDGTTVETLYVSQWEHDVARLVDGFDHRDFARYFKRSGFTILG